TLTVPIATGRVRVALSWYYNDGFFWDFNNARREDAYDILNASIGWSSADERLGVRLFGSNLTHSKYSIYTVSQVPGDDFAAASPRTYGVEFSFSINPR
ncbi:MAG: TonB-dependent receptor, partial [Steroidobacteraceae bacterium]